MCAILPRSHVPCDERGSMKRRGKRSVYVGVVHHGDPSGKEKDKSTIVNAFKWRWGSPKKTSA